MIVDFHMHTTESDGVLSPRSLVDLVRMTGIDFVSITDHDTMSAYERQPEAFAAVERRLVRGLEVSSRSDGRDVHLLAYGVPLGSSPLRELIGDRSAARRHRAAQIIEKLNRLGIDIADHDVRRHAGGEMLSRAHVARALIKKGVVRDVDEAFERYLGRGAAAFVPIAAPSSPAVIAAIRESGGIAVLAHPSRGGAAASIDDLVEAGLQGLEVFYRAHDRNEVYHYRNIARDLKLVMTAGSDFHEPSERSPAPGCDVEEEDIEPFLKHVGLA